MTGRYDYRGTYLPEVIPAHVLGIRHGEITHACPECPIAMPKPLCPVCLGAGHITADRLDRWQVDIERRGMPAGSATLERGA